ncbi:hypothetical protein PTKIN_Ptkin15bG0189100 [Pterospermum kingtungense]
MKEMGPANTTTSNDKLSFSSPAPYILGSFGLVLILITVALALLACSYRKRYSNSSSSNEVQQKQDMAMNTVVHDPEPEIVVIMAGDDKPTFLAKSVSSSNSNCCLDAAARKCKRDNDVSLKEALSGGVLAL